MASATFANSPGWNETGPIDTQSRAPFTVCPMTGSIGRISSTMPVNMAT
jgi:hypothetical protein